MVTAFDPVAQQETEITLGKDVIQYAYTVEDCIREAQAILLMTSWAQFEELPQQLAGLPQQPLLIDGRRMIPKDSVAVYEGIGLTRG